MVDEETGAEPRAVSASIVDPFLQIIRDDSSVCVFQIDGNLELEEVEREDETLRSTKWLTGCLYKDECGIFASTYPEQGTSRGKNIFMFLLNGNGVLYVSVPPCHLGG